MVEINFSRTSFSGRLLIANWIKMQDQIVTNWRSTWPTLSKPVRNPSSFEKWILTIFAVHIKLTDVEIRVKKRISDLNKCSAVAPSVNSDEWKGRAMSVINVFYSKSKKTVVTLASIFPSDIFGGLGEVTELNFTCKNSHPYASKLHYFQWFESASHRSPNTRIGTVLALMVSVV